MLLLVNSFSRQVCRLYDTREGRAPLASCRTIIEFIDIICHEFSNTFSASRLAQRSTYVVEENDTLKFPFIFDIKPTIIDQRQNILAFVRSVYHIDRCLIFSPIAFPHFYLIHLRSYISYYPVATRKSSSAFYARKRGIYCVPASVFPIAVSISVEQMQSTLLLLLLLPLTTTPCIQPALLTMHYSLLIRVRGHLEATHNHLRLTS